MFGGGHLVAQGCKKKEAGMKMLLLCALAMLGIVVSQRLQRHPDRAGDRCDCD